VSCGRLEITPRLSIGGAITAGGRGAEELIHAADLAMYQVKAGDPGPVVTDLDLESSATAIGIPTPR
jgi:GGDEF domain-containing protein